MASGDEEDVAAAIAKKEVTVSEEEHRLFEALKLLGINPTLSDPADIHRLITAFQGKPVKKEPSTSSSKPATPDPKPMGLCQYPKISIFFGDEPRGEVSWATFKYEVDALIDSKSYTDEQVLHGMRRSLKGKAGDKLRILGTDVKLRDVLRHLDIAYGTVESKESVMRKLYQSQQGLDETVEAYASRIEDLYHRAVNLRAIPNTEGKELLKETFHAGLRKDLKLMTMYQKDAYFSFDELKRALRKLESDLKSDDNIDTKKPCKAAYHSGADQREKKTEDKSEMSEIKEILTHINKRIDGLEKEKEHPREDSASWYQPSYRDRDQPYYRGRGRGYYRGQPQDRGRGRGNYRPQRPIGSQAFQPTCFICKEKGHIQMKCPRIISQLVCTRCKEPGHYSGQCPN